MDTLITGSMFLQNSLYLRLFAGKGFILGYLRMAEILMGILPEAGVFLLVFCNNIFNYRLLPNSALSLRT